MSRLRRVSNCLIVAASAWMQGRAKHWIAARRSHGLGGKMLHFAHIRERDGVLTMVYFIPRRRKVSFLDEGQSFVIFDGLYRVQRFRLEELGTGDTLSEAARSARGSRGLKGRV